MSNFPLRKNQKQEDMERLALKAVTKELIEIIEKSGTEIFYCYIKPWEIWRAWLNEIHQALSDEIQGDSSFCWCASKATVWHPSPARVSDWISSEKISHMEERLEKNGDEWRYFLSGIICLGRWRWAKCIGTDELSFTSFFLL